MKRTEGRLYFWGGILSNWAFVPEKIKVQLDDGTIKLFPTSEHLFMWFKASYFHDKDAMREIETVKMPNLAKSIGRRVRNFNEDAWSEVREEFMLLSLRYKAASWHEFREFIKNETREFVEASPYDKIWGIGMDVETAANEDNPNDWNGLNLLGKALGKLREELINEN